MRSVFKTSVHVLTSMRTGKVAGAQAQQQDVSPPRQNGELTSPLRSISDRMQGR